MTSRSRFRFTPRHANPHTPRILYRATAIVALSSAAWGVCAEMATEPSAREKTALEAAFARADVNSDGRLSQQEAARLPAIEAKFAELDTDKDGWLSLTEFAVGYTAPD